MKLPNVTPKSNPDKRPESEREQPRLSEFQSLCNFNCFVSTTFPCHDYLFTARVIGDRLHKWGVGDEDEGRIYVMVGKAAIPASSFYSTHKMKDNRKKISILRR